MSVRTVTVATLSLGLLLSAPGAAVAAQGRAPKPIETLQLPIGGTGPGGAVFSGTLSFEKFVVRDNRVAAMVLVRGSLASATGAPLGTTLARVAVAVRVEHGTLPVSGDRAEAVQQR